MKNHIRVKLDKMNGDHAEKKRVAEKPVLLSENSHLRIVELASTGNLSAGSILNEHLRNNEQICPWYRECTHYVCDIVLHLVASDRRFN